MITCGPTGTFQTFVNWFIQVLLQDIRLEKTHLRIAASATQLQRDIPSEKAAPLLWRSGDSNGSSTHWGLWEVPIHSIPAPSQEQGDSSWNDWRSTKLWGQTEHLMLMADATGRLLPPVLQGLYVFTFWKKKKKNQHWKVLLGLSFHKKQGGKVPLPL